MRWLVTFACAWAVVSAIPPSPDPECPIEILPIPEPVPVVGLLSHYIKDLIESCKVTFKAINDAQALDQQQYRDYIRQIGGPGFHDAARKRFMLSQGDRLWALIVDITADITWKLSSALNEDVAIIEKQFSLVIDQPKVRSWLREIRDIIRVGRNQILQLIKTRRAEWSQFVSKAEEQLEIVIKTGLCQSPDTMRKRFYRMTRTSLSQSVDFVHQLENDIQAIVMNLAQHAVKLANNIYGVEIAALKYFVT